VFKDLPTKANDKQWTLQRAILAPLNETVNNINHQVITRFPGTETTHKSIDSTVTQEEATHFPVEFTRNCWNAIT
jgi:hypothetical protein